MPQVVTDTIPGGLTALNELEWDLGGYRLGHVRGIDPTRHANRGRMRSHP